MEKKKKDKKDKKRIILLSLAAVIFASAGFVAGPGRTLVKKHKETKIKAAYEAQVKEKRKKAYDDEYVQAQMMDYLEERYHEKFVMKYYQCNLGTYYGDYVVMGVWPEGKEDEKHLFEVEGHPDTEGNLNYSDTYVNMRIEKEMKDYFRPYMDKYYDEYLSYGIFFSGASFNYNVPADITLDELFAHKYEADLDFSIHVERQEVDSNFGNLESLAKELQDNKFRGTFSVALFETNKNKLDDESYWCYREYVFHISDEKITMKERF